MGKDRIISDLAQSLGGIVRLSLALGLSRAAAAQWTRVPVEHVLPLERLTGISRHRIRPDIYGVESRTRD